MKRLLLQAPALFGRAYLQQLLNTQSAALVGIWQLNESAGRIAASRIDRSLDDVDLLANGGFETAGAGGADVFAYTQESAGDGAIADETSLVNGGSHACKLTAGASANTYIRPFDIMGSFINVRPGDACTLSFWTRGDGTNQGRYSVYDFSNSAWIRSTVNTGVAGTTYTEVTYEFTAPAGCYGIYINLLCSTVNTGVCYFDDVTLTVSNLRADCIYQPSGITYGQTGIIPGIPCIAVNGSNSGILMGNKAYHYYTNPNQGAVIAWGKVDGSGRWTDASTYRYLWHPKSRQDGTVYMCVGKTTTNHQLTWRRRVAVAVYEQTHTFSPSGTLDWFCMGMVWDVLSSPQRIATFLYTHADRTWQKLSDEEPSSGNEEWDKDTYSLDNTNCVLMGGTTTDQEWIGSGSVVAEWAGATLSDAEIKKAMTP
jgi:hypothetical protein